MLVARTYKVAVNSTPEPAILRDFSPALRNALESVQCITYYPAGAVLFVESQPSRGVLFLPRGRIKLSVCARDSKTLILRVAQPGEALGVGAAVCGRTCEPPTRPCTLLMVGEQETLRASRKYWP
jgi:CRP/FNR family cyclic AMP-dependent transcriptional regulator